ncbi:gamma-glutamylcyclotransferase AIG2-like protein [Fadolivirus algeromassiliense]|jgi:gamma-glutamylcyclotransferase (GGCT)/AIG2-like uncharacterized protein YtfP|uniref:Gamma-glutamylcyclotransferase AIG2-like protein n=1 Tax=Fadolivirus FV1/VV64 TaxID=3070911 RepID=A0A7D3QUZ4_9VIRU|nr:gamma-glutamylcyclotransferase AIG2-like protein [Fadolivirus algeromassiliense]QKF94583.1 gamma-glutamylcyclotransferase AIG2-like protein [Fadolivirus FV1/VV64]
MYSLFTYGILRPTNRNPTVLNLNQYIDKTISGKLYGYKLIVNEQGFIPSVIESDNKDDYVIGEVIICNSHEKYESILDIVDLISDNFDRDRVKIQTEEGILHSAIYIIIDHSHYIDCGYSDYYEYLKNEKKLLVNI